MHSFLSKWNRHILLGWSGNRWYTSGRGVRYFDIRGSGIFAHRPFELTYRTCRTGLFATFRLNGHVPPRRINNSALEDLERHGITSLSHLPRFSVTFDCVGVARIFTAGFLGVEFPTESASA